MSLFTLRKLASKMSRKEAEPERRRPRSRWQRYRLALERLEDRLAPAVTFSFTSGTLSAVFGAASDTATITATAAGSFDYSGTGSALASQSGVTAITVSDSAAAATQSVTLNGTGFNITGALSITGIETVTFATTDTLLAGSMSETGATTAVQLNSPGITTTGTQSFAAANPVTLGNATALTSTGLTMAGTVALGANALTVAGGGTISGVISGTGSLATTTSGTLTLSGTNTFTSATPATALTIGAGTTVSTAADLNLGVAANGVTLNGGTLLVTATITAAARPFTMGTGGGTISTTGGYTIPVAATITGGNGLTKSGAGDLIVLNSTAANAPGAINITAGRFFFATQNSLGTGAITVGSGATLDYNSTVAGALALANTVTIASGANVSNRNTGILTLNASTVLPTSGTVTFDSDDAATNSAGIFIQAGDTLSGTLTIQVGGNFASITGNASGGFANIQGVVNAGANAINKTGPGTLKLTNISAATPNTMTGTVTVSAGVLEVFTTQTANTNALGTANVVLNGGTLKLDPVPSVYAGSTNSLFGRYFNAGFTPTNSTTGTTQFDFSGIPAATRNETGGLNFAVAS